MEPVSNKLALPLIVGALILVSIASKLTGLFHFGSATGTFLMFTGFLMGVTSVVALTVMGSDRLG